MSADTTPRHVAAEVLVEYFEHRLPEGQCVQIEEHLADCQDCIALARRVRRFCNVWDQWTATAHATALQQVKTDDRQLEESRETLSPETVALNASVWPDVRFGQQPIKVVIAHDELSEREKLKGLLAGEADIQVVGEARDGKECLELVMRQHPDVVLIKEDMPVLNGLAVAEQITSDVPEVVVILILTGSEGQEVWHKMLRAGIREFITLPVTADRLLEEVRKVAAIQAKAAKRLGTTSAAQPAVAEGPKRQVITVTGPRGGCGKTVIAANLAVALARANENVALVDLNLWGGDIAMLLDVTPKRTLGDLLPGFGGIDYDVVDSIMSKHTSGVSVLAAPLTGTFDGSTLSRYIVQSILEALREHYEYTVVDTGYANLESTLAAMDYSDQILVVVGMDLPRLRDGKLYLKNLLAANYPKEKIRVIVNRTTSSKEISSSEVETILEFPVTVQIPTDDALVGSSVNLGQTFVSSNPNKPVARALLALAENVSPSSAAARRRKAPRFRLFLC